MPLAPEANSISQVVESSPLTRLVPDPSGRARSVTHVRLPAQTLLAENPDLPEALHLHARRLIFRHPVTGKKIDITAPVGPEMKKTMKYFGFPDNAKSDPFEDIE